MKSQVSGFYLPISRKTRPLVPCCIPEAESSVKTAHIPCMGWHKLPVVFPLPYHTPSPCHSAKSSPRDLFIRRAWFCPCLLEAARRPAVALSRKHLFATLPSSSGHYAPSHLDSQLHQVTRLERTCHGFLMPPSLYAAWPLRGPFPLLFDLAAFCSHYHSRIQQRF